LIHLRACPLVLMTLLPAVPSLAQDAAPAPVQPAQTPAPVAAGDADEPAVLRLGEPDDTLHVAIAPYVWITSYSGDVTVQGTEYDATASFLDILDESDSVFGLMGALDVEYKRFVFQFNAAWTTAEISKASATASGGTVSGDMDIDSAWFELFAGYRLLDKPMLDDAQSKRRFTLDAFVGGRATSIDVDVTLTAETDVTLPDGTFVPMGTTTDRGDSKDWLEPFVGARIGLDLSDNWSLHLRGDVGGFGIDGSEFSWQLAALVGYRWQMEGWTLGVFGGYRAVAQDYADGGFRWDMIVHGPMIGANFLFSF
jgi:hypothetical protein